MRLSAIKVGAQASLAMKVLCQHPRCPCRTKLGTSEHNEGVFVDKTTFKLHLGKPKGEPAAEITRTGAKEVSQGAIIFRSDGKLYIVDAKPTE